MSKGLIYRTQIDMTVPPTEDTHLARLTDVVRKQTAAYRGGLNDLWQPGKLPFIGGYSASATNRPSDTDGYIIVTHWDNRAYCAQLVIDAHNRVFTRTNQNPNGGTAWSAWTQLATTSDTSTWIPLAFTPSAEYVNDGIAFEYNRSLRQFSIDLQGFELPANTPAGANLGMIEWVSGFIPSIAKRIVVAGDIVGSNDNTTERVAILLEFNIDGRLSFYPVSGAVWNSRVKLYGDAVIRFD